MMLQKPYIEPVKVSLSFSGEGSLIDKVFNLLRLKFRFFTIFLKLCNLPAPKTRHFRHKPNIVWRLNLKNMMKEYNSSQVKRIEEMPKTDKILP